VFIHDNGKVCVLCATRCGHTSMYHHFTIEPHSITDPIDVWIKSKSQRVLVLRNPYARWISASKHSRKVRKRNPNMTSEQFQLNLRVHGAPYLHKISRSIDFKIIDFDRLSEYITMSDDTFVTNSKWEDRHKKAKAFVELRSEYNNYLYFMKYCKEITPDEWKLLTIGDDSDILVE